MDYKQLKSGIKEITDIVASVPEKFQDKCFELLLTSLLGQKQSTERPDKTNEKENSEPDPSAKERKKPDHTSIPVTTQLRLLMKKTNVTIDELDKVVMYANDELHFIREPHDVGISTGQVEWALLMALKNTILKDSMTADPEAIRSICQAKGFYDKANFAANFKSVKNAKMFKSPLVPQGSAEPLSSEGQDALGKLIKRLASEEKK